jgi:hypothetical protein
MARDIGFRRGLLSAGRAREGLPEIAEFAIPTAGSFPQPEED